MSPQLIFKMDSATTYNLNRLRSVLLSDVVQLSELQDNLFKSQNYTVSLEFRTKLTAIFERWAKLRSSIRPPDVVNVTTALSYCDYLSSEIMKWRATDMAKFNRLLNVLLANVPSSDYSLSELISTAESYLEPAVASAATSCRKTLEAWEQSFPHLSYGDEKSGISAKMAAYMTRLHTDAFDGLLLLRPSARLADLTEIDVDGSETGLARVVSSQRSLSANVQRLSTGAPWHYIDSISMGGMSRYLRFISRYVAAVANQTRETVLYSIPKGGMTWTMTCEFSNPGQEATFSLRDGMFVFNTQTVGYDSVLRVWKGPANVGAPFLSVGIVTQVANVIVLPYDDSVTYTVSIQTTFNAGAPPAEAFAVHAQMVTLERVVFHDLRAITQFGSLDATPFVIDLIGTLVPSLSYLAFSEEVSSVWKLMRRYFRFLEVNGVGTPVTLMKTQAVRLGVAEAAIDQRIFDLSWWLSYTSDVSVSKKKALYRVFYPLLIEYISMATTDSAFYTFLLG